MLISEESSLMFAYATKELNNEAVATSLDILEGQREIDLIYIEAHKQRIWKYYNKKANLRYFKVGEYVLQNSFSPS